MNCQTRNCIDQKEVYHVWTMSSAWWFIVSQYNFEGWTVTVYPVVFVLSRISILGPLKVTAW